MANDARDSKTDDGRARPHNFIRDLVDRDLASGKYQGRVVTRFPPEPNGYPHIGHAKSICLNFGLARDYGGRCHLRFDDTNPAKEEVEYVEAIKADIRWLGFDWGEHLYFASDYFERLYACAVTLIETGHAYVCSLSEAEIREQRGTITTPGSDSPYRARPVAENLDLFRRMRAGEFPDGAHVLRGKIDMAATNMKLRDPVLYRIRHATHYRTGDAWCVYPMYDFTHCLSDAFEDVTHSLCTLEFENNRVLYDWVLDALGYPRPRPEQTEFARLSVDYTVTSKRRLLALVEGGHVSGWDDPRMPTLAGLRRGGVTPEAVREFCDRVGVAKNNSVVDFGHLEHVVRDDLNARSPRVLCVLNPMELILEDLAEDQVEPIDAPYWPIDVPKTGSRSLTLTRRILIERDDFEQTPPPGFHRLSPGACVRLRHGPVVRAQSVDLDDAGTVIRARCVRVPEDAPDAAGVRGTIHWVAADHAMRATVRLYDRLFSHPEPGHDDHDFLDDLNPASLEAVEAFLEPSLAHAEGGQRFQFERLGFFFVDPVDSRPGAPVFNRTVALKDSWGKRHRPAAPTPERTRRDQDKDAQRREARERLEGRALGERAQAYVDTHGINAEQAAVIAAHAVLAALFDSAVGSSGNPKYLATLLTGPVRARADVGSVECSGSALAEVSQLVDDARLSIGSARQVVERMLEGEGSPGDIIERHGLWQVSDDVALLTAIDAVLASHEREVERYRGGAQNLLGMFVGKVMRATRGAADAKRVGELLRQRLSGE